MNSLEDIWKSVMELMGNSLTDVAINTWFSECRVTAMDETGLTLLVPSSLRPDS